jgi:hypothetical protein
MSSLTYRLELEPIEIGRPGNESRLYQHRCGHVEWWPLNHIEGLISSQGCDACESAPVPGSWRTLHALPWRDR